MYNKTDKIDWQSELQIFKNKPRAIEHATYLKALPVKIKEYLLPENLSIRRDRIKVLIKLLDDYTITEIEKAISTGLNNTRTSFSDIKAILYYQRTENRSNKPLDESFSPESVINWQPSLADYNELCQEVIS
ncbi:MAG: hypothetical protein ACOC1K_00675 [Nanoarchaeota archaeon]